MTASSLGYRAAAPTGAAAGTLFLSAAHDGVRTRPARTESAGTLRLMAPLYLDDSGQLTYVLVSPGGAYFGETYHIEMEVQPGANLLVSSQGATRIYRTPQEPACQEAVFRVGAGARFEYVPEQTIAYRDADYRATTSITAAADAQVFVGEIVTPGWDPDGVPFTYLGMRLRTDVFNEEGRPALTDNVRIAPEAIGPALSGIGYLEGSSHMGSVLVLGPQTQGAYIDEVRAIATASGLPRVGVTAGSRHGLSWLMVRALAPSTDALAALISAVNTYDRSVTTGQGRLDLRRY